MTTLSEDYTNRTIQVSHDDPDVARMPRLCRFYGISFQELWRLPRWLLIEFDNQISEISAREQLLAFQAADWPNMTQRGRRDLHRDVVKFAGLAAAAPVNPTKDIGRLAGMGIKVVMPEAKTDA